MQVTLRVTNIGNLRFEFDREFVLRDIESPVASHVHFTDGHTEGYLDFTIAQGDENSSLRVQIPAGTLSSQVPWMHDTLAVRRQDAAGWALTVKRRQKR